MASQSKFYLFVTDCEHYRLKKINMKLLLTNESCEQILRSFADYLAMSYLICYNISKEDKTLKE